MQALVKLIALLISPTPMGWAKLNCSISPAHIINLIPF